MFVKDLRPALRAFLLSDSGISGMVGTRIYPLRLPQGDRGPSIVYSRPSEQTDHHMQGPSGLVFVRYQIDAWAKSADDASSLANLIKSRINGYKGPMSDGSSTLKVQGIFAETIREDYDSEAELFRVSRDYFIDYAER